MVELALCFMVFLMLTFGSVEFGWAVYAYNSCSYLAQDAARWASVHGSLSATPATMDSVRAHVLSGAMALDPTQLTVTTTWTPNNSPGSVVRITVGYTMQPLVGLAMTQSLPMASIAQFYINR